MNGVSTRNYGYDGSLLSPNPTQAVGPGAKQILEGYRKDLTNGFASEQPRYNPLNMDRPQSSSLVDLKDPIQVHLLTETALSDSKEWEILSQEEVDDLKKVILSLTVRIEQARANLAIQTKYRDAAISMSKLYTAGNVGNRQTVDPRAGEAAMERQASEQTCEDLASELFDLEKRILAPQRKLLQHTAAILQLTHKASKKKNSGPGPMPNGVPGSPESLYTYSNGRNSMQFPGDDLEDRSLYFPLDEPKNSFAIPARSPVRQQTNQLRDELETLKKESDEQLNVITKAERSLEELNNQLRDLVIQMNPTKNADYSRAPSGNAEPGNMVTSQLDYLAQGLATIQQGQQEQKGLVADSARKSDVSAASLRSIEERFNALNRQVFEVVKTVEPDQPPPPDSLGMGLGMQFGWIEDSVEILQSQLTKNTTSSAGIQQAQQVETVLQGLWDIIQSGYANINQQRESRRQTRLGKGLPDDEDDVSSDESWDFEEQYSLPAFSAKVQWLFQQATGLKEHKSVLRRQLRQQRELNSKSDSDKDIELKNKIEELQRTKHLLNFSEENAQQAKKEAEEAQTKLEKALADLENSETTASAVATDQVRERNAKITSLEADQRALQDKLEIVQAQLGPLTEQLREADDAKQAAEQEADKLREEIKSKDEDLEQLNITMIELKTEVTIAKAELEGAYGSRSERAAEAAALTKSEQMREMQKQIEKLKKELADTVKELEDLTKETLASEKEKVDLEGRLDDAVSSKTTLETEIGTLRDKYNNEVTQLKEELDKEKFKAAPNAAGTGPRAGATMLSEQFRATMKEERRKFNEELREEQNRRRKLEEELRALKKAAGPRGSTLSPQ